MKKPMMAILAAGVVLSGACADDPADPVPPAPVPPSRTLPSGQVELAVACEPATFAAGEEAVVTVAARNTSWTAAHLGIGSSSCALSATVRYGDEDVAMVVERVCTPDESERWLGPGGVRTERWLWTGEVSLPDGRMTLPVGSYQIVGRTGEAAGESVTVSITEPDPPTEPGIVMSIAVDPPVLTPGESVTVTVRAENTGDDVVTVYVGSYTCMIGTQLAFEGGVCTMVEDRFCTDFGGPFDFEPGYVREMSWQWWGDVRTGDGLLTLPAGTYEVMSVMGLGGRFTSEPVTITVTN